MTLNQALVQQRPAPLAFASSALTRDQIELLKRTVAKGTTDDEFALFLATATRMGLDPFAKQIYAVKRWDRRANREVMSIQVGVDGHRLAAIRTGELDGEDGPFWCGSDRVWVDVWLDDEPPAAAKFIVYRKGCSRPFTAVARYRSYVQLVEGRPNPMWDRGSDFMLAKCAEALAKRKAFPAELSGVIAPEEAGSEDYAPDFQPLPASASALTAPKIETLKLQAQPVDDVEAARAERAARRDPTPTQGPGSAAGELGDSAARERFVNGEPIAPVEQPRAKPAPEISDEKAMELTDELLNAPDITALKATAAKIGKLRMSDAVRADLLSTYQTRARFLTKPADAAGGAA